MTCIEFNLVDEPWIPCRLSRDEPGICEFGIEQTLLRAPEIVEIAAETPLMTITLHRLLLAVLHRCFGPPDIAIWTRMWTAGAWDDATIVHYLAKWRHRFNLFDEAYPFYQTAALDFSFKCYPLVRQFQLAGAGTLFEHDLEQTPATVNPAMAARMLVAFQAFDLGGIKTAERGRDYADAGPLSQCAVSLIHGDSLFHTLLLNLHRYDGTDDAPFAFDPEQDRPAWERDEPPQPRDRAPTGYLDYLTWQSRRLRLRPEGSSAGGTAVREAIVMKGDQLPSWGDRQRAETMVAFRKRRSATAGEEAWAPVGFTEDRALWRDSLAIFQSVAGESARPKMLDWLDELADEVVIGRREIVPVDFYGMTVDRANALFWRHEQLRLPLVCLDNEVVYGALQQALTLAEQTASLLRAGYCRLPHRKEKEQPPTPCRTLATELLGTDDRGALERFVAGLAPERSYWINLATPYDRLVIDLATAATERGSMDEVFAAWGETVAQTARTAFANATAGLDTSARALRATALAERDFGRFLRAIMTVYFPIEAPVAPGGDS